MGDCPVVASDDRIVVLLDSNFLMYMASGMITPSMILDAIEHKYTLATLTCVISELSRVEATSPQLKYRRLASRALELIKELGVTIIDVRAEGLAAVDDVIVETAKALKSRGCRVVVGSNDRDLRRRLRRLGIPTMYYRESEGILEVDFLTP